ncbi:MAG TPA: 2-oxo acid dehydrogenase subunit E2, partial [Kofleriaceae bacterium]|nr:2-oxo acid dehydrogenase subunit E2 [Kofleriaceae bacterium]
ETDKANMDFNLEDEGVLLKLLVSEGDTVKLGAPVAILGEEGEDVSDLMRQAQAGGAADKAAAQAAPAGGEEPAREGAAQAARAEQVQPEERAAPAQARAPAPKKPAAPARDGKAAARKPAPAAPAGGKVLASPLAKSLAIELGVDLRQVKGTGPGGRIVERDVREAAEGGGAAAEVELLEGPPETGEEARPEAREEEAGGEDRALALITPGPLAVPGASDEYVDRPLTPARKTIAQRLTQAKREMPHFRLTAVVDAGPLVDFRLRLNHLLGDRGKVSINDLLLKGAALALRRVPECNVSFVGDALRYYTRVHLGVAVALEQGLITPVIRNADLKGIGVISAEMRDLVDRAKRRQLKAHEIQGATFSVSNLGMFGIDQFDAIINPPAACILAIGRIQRIPVVEGERIAIGDRLALTLSCDHRAVDGALGARYMDELRDILERPESLAL